MALLLKADGGQSPFDLLAPPPGKDRLTAVQQAVGGYVEVVQGRRDATLVFMCDEEGQLTNRPPNYFASEIAGRPLVGDVIACSQKELAAWDAA